MTDEVSGPLDAACAARKHTSYDELTSVEDGLWWLQSDPDLGRARRLVQMVPEGSPWPQTPPDVSVGGPLHAYCGGSYMCRPPVRPTALELVRSRIPERSPVRLVRLNRTM